MQQPVDESELLNFIQSNYGLHCSGLEQIPVGENSLFYKATSAKGQIGIKIQTKFNATLLATFELLKNNKYSHFPQVVETLNNDPVVKFADSYVQIQNFVEPKRLFTWDERVDDGVLIELGGALAELHNLDTGPLRGVLNEESYTSAYLSKAEAEINNFMAWQNDGEEVNLIKQLFNNSEPIRKLFADAKVLGNQLDKSKALCITHGDIHFANILIDQNDKLFIVDWDHAELALPGMDLAYFDDEQITVLSKGYGQDLTSWQNEIKYYRNNLMLRAIWFYLPKAYDATEPKERQEALTTINDIFNDSEILLRSVK